MQENDPVKEENLDQAADKQAANKRADELTILRNLLGPKQPGLSSGRMERPSDQGREVSLKAAFSCIEHFAPAMREHGIVDDMSSEVFLDGMSTATMNNTIVLKKRRITESEEFAGPNLLNWMIKVVRRYDASGQGKNMVIRLMLGIYNDAFLDYYLPSNTKDRDVNAKNDNLKQHKKDRITIFLVPCYYNANGEQIDFLGEEQEEAKTEDQQNVTDAARGGSNGGKPTAYDLGGLKP